MTDVLMIAMNRRDKLLAEIGRVDRFLRLAVELVDSVPVEPRVQNPVEYTPTINAKPGPGREADAVQPSERDAVTEPARNGRASIFRGAFADADDLQRVANG